MVVLPVSMLNVKNREEVSCKAQNYTTTKMPGDRGHAHTTKIMGQIICLHTRMWGKTVRDVKQPGEGSAVKGDNK